MGKLGIMGNLSKQQNTHSTQNTQPNLTTNNYLYSLNVILSGAKNLAVSDFGDACTDLEIFRYAQDDTL